MYAALDELVLSGKLFNGDSRPSSPTRSRSTSPHPTVQWPELDEDINEKGLDYDSDRERSKRIEKILSTHSADAPDEAIGMGPGRTGVKGVLRDRAEAQSRARAKRAREIDELNRKMERAALVGNRTVLDDEREAEWERMMLEGLEPDVSAARGEASAKGKALGRFGHLREVGVAGFVNAVENEAKGVWVVVHIYDPSLDRCFALDATLSRLARLSPDVKFLRARAGAIGFASLSSSASSRTDPSRLRIIHKHAGLRIRHVSEDDDDDDEDEHDDKEARRDGYEDDDVDLDVLPTLLVYRDGELVYNWVRVDWEAGRQGVEELLYKHRILKGSSAGFGNCGLPSDDEGEDLFLSDPDDAS